MGTVGRGEPRSTRQPTEAPVYVELAFAALAHVPPGDGEADPMLAITSLHDPRYVAWARATLPPAAWRPLAEEAPRVARLLTAARPREVLALQLLPGLHHGMDQLMSTAKAPLSALSGADVADAAALDALRTVPTAVIELLRCGMLLCAPSWSAAHAARVAPAVSSACDAVAPWLALATDLAPRLARHRVALGHALGVRGRALGRGRIYVGAPCAWNGLPPEHAALQALHEVAADAAASIDAEPAQSDRARWAQTEGLALAAVAEVVRGSPLESAHQAWAARFDPSAVASADADARSAVVQALRAVDATAH